MMEFLNTTTTISIEFTNLSIIIFLFSINLIALILLVLTQTGRQIAKFWYWYVKSTVLVQLENAQKFFGFNKRSIVLHLLNPIVCCSILWGLGYFHF